jgi:hypothetical protein
MTHGTRKLLPVLLTYDTDSAMAAWTLAVVVSGKCLLLRRTAHAAQWRVKSPGHDAHQTCTVPRDVHRPPHVLSVLQQTDTKSRESRPATHILASALKAQPPSAFPARQNTRWKARSWECGDDNCKGIQQRDISAPSLPQAGPPAGCRWKEASEEKLALEGLPEVGALGVLVLKARATCVDAAARLAFAPRVLLQTSQNVDDTRRRRLCR